MITEKEKIKIERDFISLLLQDRDLCGRWLESGPKTEFFQEIHHPILYAVNYANGHDVLLTRSSFTDYLRKNQFKKIDIQVNENLFDLVSSLFVQKDDFPTLRSQIIDSYIGSKSISCIEKYGDNLKNKGSIFASEKLKEELASLVETSTIEKTIVYEPIDTYSSEFMEELLVKKDAKEDESVKCHIKEIDDTMVVGFFPGTLTLVCGDVGSFKSTMMLNMAINIWKLSKKNVLFVPLEMPRDKLYQKLLSRETGVPFDRIEIPSLLDKEEWDILEKTPKEWEDWDHKFYLMDAPERVPVSTIKRTIEKYVNIFKPDVVVIDYIANLVADKGDRTERNDLLIGSMLKDLRHMGRRNSVHSKGFAIISAAQIGRDALKRVRNQSSKAMFYSEDLRGSHEYSMDADNIYAQMVDPQQPDKKLQLFVVKARYGRKTFLNGTQKAVLEVRPEISMIKSIEDSFFQKNKSDILSKVDSNNLDFAAMLEEDEEDSGENDYKISQELEKDFSADSTVDSDGMEDLLGI